MIGVTILGATGSIGINTLHVIEKHPECYRVIALTAHRNVARMLKCCMKWQPEFAVMADPDCAESLQQNIRKHKINTTVLAGTEGLQQVATLTQTDYVMAAIVGAAGLLPTLAAIKAGKRILLANKEALVMSGQLFMDTTREYKTELLPIDSEHNAIFQCMPIQHQDGLACPGVRRIFLTGSGGPFRNTKIETLSEVTPESACTHPNWDMGPKISVDSATMMNKGLELIEACWLFDMQPENIEIVLHPQSIVHSMVEYIDGSVLAQLGNPDMRTPIAHALAWPERIDSGVKYLDLFEVARLDFEAPDTQRFPCLQIAQQAMTIGGTATAILNAANEVAVEAFLSRQVQFTDIANIVNCTLENVSSCKADTLGVILQADEAARHYANEVTRRLAA